MARAATTPPSSRAALRAACGIALVLAVSTTGCGERRQARASAPASQPHLLDRAELQRTEPRADEGWPMATGDYANTRYSRLRDIHAGNVAQLEVAWTFDTGLTAGHEAAPLVVGDTMYVTTPFPNRLYALDLNDRGRVKWMFDPHPAPAAQGVACCDVVNRGAAYWNGLVVYNTLDDQTIAVDAVTGRERWRTSLGDIHRGETMTMAPMVVRDRVLVGNSGGEFGVRGWLAALDAATGAIAWRAYSTGPDRDVLIGPSFHPFYESDRGADLGVDSWPPGRWRIGGGTIWGFLAYDPELDLVYSGTGNPGPWNPDQRPGDNKWTAGIFARRPETGEAVWFYQWSPHDLYDHDGTNESVLLDLTIDGRRRRVLVHPDRNGYVYVLDRETGEMLSARAFVPVTTSRGVDPHTGRLVPIPEMAPGFGRAVRGICPGSAGGKDWQPSAFSFDTGLLYIPHNNLCQDEHGVEANYIAGTPFVGAEVRMYRGEGGHGGAFTAWDPVAGRAAWSIPERWPVWSGALATAGDLAFYGTMDGFFVAVHARTGEVLWRYRTQSGIIGQPVTYRGPDGRQYVAVFSGVGGWSGMVVVAHLDTRDESADDGFATAMRDLPLDTRAGGRLYVFALP